MLKCASAALSVCATPELRKQNRARHGRASDIIDLLCNGRLAVPAGSTDIFCTLCGSETEGWARTGPRKRIAPAVPKRVQVSDILDVTFPPNDVVAERSSARASERVAPKCVRERTDIKWIGSGPSLKCCVHWRKRIPNRAVFIPETPHRTSRRRRAAAKFSGAADYQWRQIVLSSSLDY